MKSRTSIPLNVIKSICENSPPSAPLSVNIQITNQCNLRCQFCGYHSFLNKTASLDGHVPAARLIQVIDELAEMGTKDITICAKGEPSCHPKFFDIINAIKKHPMSLDIYTNLSAKSPSSMKAFIKADRLIINLSAIDEESYKKIHSPQAQGTFDQVLKNITSINKIGARKKIPELEICYIITRNNFRAIGKAIALAASLGVQAIRFRNMHTEKYTKSLVLNKAELKELLLIILHLIKKPTPLQTNLRDLLQEIMSHQKTRAPFDHCFVGWFSLALDSRGTLSFCCQHMYARLGNWEKDSIRDIWAGKTAANYRKLAKDHFHHQKIFGKYCHFCPYASTNAQIEASLYGGTKKTPIPKA